MARSRHGFVTRRGVTRRETIWISNQPATTPVAGNTAILLSVLNAAALALRPFTIVRTRGRIGCFSDQVSADENYGVAYGLAVVSEQASAIGVTAIPTPITDMGSDLFFAYDGLAGRFSFVSAVGFHPNAGQWKDIDSKAMRRVNADQDLVSVVEANSGIGQNFFDAWRMLIKLH